MKTKRYLRGVGGYDTPDALWQRKRAGRDWSRVVSIGAEKAESNSQCTRFDTPLFSDACRPVPPRVSGGPGAGGPGASGPPSQHRAVGRDRLHGRHLEVRVRDVQDKLRRARVAPHALEQEVRRQLTRRRQRAWAHFAQNRRLHLPRPWPRAVSTGGRRARRARRGGRRASTVRKR